MLIDIDRFDFSFYKIAPLQVLFLHYSLHQAFRLQNFYFTLDIL